MLHSNRLHLRALELSDADFLYEVENDHEAWKYSDTIAPLSRKILRDYALTYDADPFSAGQLRLIISEEETNRLVGIVDLYDVSHRHLRAFIGIYILKEFRNQGYGQETLKLVEQYAHNNLHLHQLGAKVEKSHKKAVDLFTELGYKVSGCLEEWLSAPDGHFNDMLIMTKKLS